MSEEEKTRPDSGLSPPTSNPKDFSLSGDEAISVDPSYFPLTDTQATEQKEFQNFCEKMADEREEELDRQYQEAMAAQQETEQELDLSDSSAAQRIAADDERKEEPAPQPFPDKEKKSLRGWLNNILLRWKKRGESILTVSIGGFVGVCWDGASTVAYRAFVLSKDIPGKSARAGAFTIGHLWGNIDFIAWAVSLCFAWRSGYMTAISGETDLVSALVGMFLALLGWQLPEGKITKAIRKPAPEVQKVIKKFLDGGETQKGEPQPAEPTEPKQ